MQRLSKETKRTFRAETETVSLSKFFDWPRRVPKDKWWQDLASEIQGYPTGRQHPWGIPFEMAQNSGLRVIMVSESKQAVTIPLNSLATHLCFLHSWNQIPTTIQRENPREGLVVAEYELTYSDATHHVQQVRARFEVAMVESPGPPWLAMPFNMWQGIDPVRYPSEMRWGEAQPGLRNASAIPLLYAMPNPYPGKLISSLTLRGKEESPLLIAGLTLYRGSAHPLRHLPRRNYRVKMPGEPCKVKEVQIDLGGIARIERTSGPRGRHWLDSPYIGTSQAGLESPYVSTSQAEEPARGGEDLIEAFGAEDATLSVTVEGKKKPMRFSLGEAFYKRRSHSGKVCLEVLDRQRQWMQVKVIDTSTGKPTPVRIHFSGSRGQYLAPYGHHSQINTNWFEDYGADVRVGGRNYAYVPGEFTTDFPVGEIYAEIYKGFEYEPIRTKVTIRPGDKILELKINRWKDLRTQGWVTADTHVHFISPQTAWLEAQAEGINVVNLLASQWGRLFTNVGDYTGRVGLVGDDTIVYVGTENRNHMLGHMSMLGTKGLPVYPMCSGGPSESWVGDPDFLTMAEWALENRRKGGVVIRPHYPYCGHTEDPLPILKGLVDALEIHNLRGEDFPIQEWYRYLNCGYRVAVAGGTDKMGAYTALGWLRTYAKLDPKFPFSYENWAKAVRAGRTISTNGPLMDLTVEGFGIGNTIALPKTGGSLEVMAIAESFWPLGKMEIVYDGQVVACQETSGGAKRLKIEEKIRATRSGWIAARCCGSSGHPGSYVAAHTSPVYIKCGQTRAFDGPAAQHMLSLVEGGIEYLETLATVFDESSRKRMVKLFNEARKELKGRLVVEAHDAYHSSQASYHMGGHE